jgi:HK97 gp10 family phage protein
VRLDGIRELRRAFEDELRRSVRGVARAVEAGAGRIAADARADAPEETGRLRASIGSTPASVRGAVVSASVTAEGGHGGEPVAAATEFGTRDEPAHPFMRPAAGRQAPSIARDVADALGGG